MSKLISKKPEDLTECWQDNERMDFLFSEFPADISVNPEHWKTKLEFWSKLIIDLSSYNQNVYIDIDTVSRWIERDGRKPLGLTTVWGHMINEKIIVLASEYIGDISRNSSWFGWGVNTFVRKPTIWAAGKMLSPLKSLSPMKTLNGKCEQYICIKAIRKKCEVLLKAMQECLENTFRNLHIISFVGLRSLAVDTATSDKDLELLLFLLEQDKKVIIFDKESKRNTSVMITEKFIKFVKPSEVNVIPVCESDTGIIKLEHGKQELEKQISALYKQQKELVQCARENLRKGQRILAKNALRQKQRIGTSLTNKELSLSNIQQMLERIQQCKTDQMIMEAYKAGVAGYNKLMKTNGMSIDVVDDTMSEVSNMLEEQEEISRTLASPVSEGDVSDDDLEKELMQLVSKDEEIVSNQTDADIAKLVSGMSSISTSSPTKPRSSSSSPAKLPTSPRKKNSQPNKPFTHAVLLT